MCGRFQKTMHYTLHATACLDQHLITIYSPTVVQCSTITDCLCSHPSPARRVSLSLFLSLCVCVDEAVYCTHRQSVGKRPPDVPGWARSSGPQTHAGLWPTHVTQLTHFVGHTPDVLAWHQITASPQTFAHAIKPACSVFWTTLIASCRSFADLLIMCMHPRTFLRARK